MNTTADRWMAVQQWDVDYLLDKLPSRFEVDWSEGGDGRMVYKAKPTVNVDKDPVALAAAQLRRSQLDGGVGGSGGGSGGGVGLSTYNTSTLAKTAVRNALATGRPFVRWYWNVHEREHPAYAPLGWPKMLSKELADWKQLSMPTGFSAFQAGDHGGGGTEAGLVAFAPPAQHPDRERINVWVGGENVTSTVHFDQHNNMFLQVQGTKRFRLSPPNHAGLR